MYVIGYFDVPFSDAVAVGYGNYSLDLASFFINRTSIVNESINWSWFIKDKNEIKSEGFGYLGLGGIIFFVYLIYYFLKNFKIIIKNKNFIPILLITIICFLIAISNKVHLLNYPIIEIKIPEIINGFLGIVRASGRIIWPVYYLLFIISIILIYKNFPKKNSIFVLILILIIQIVDIYPGIHSHYNSKAFVNQKKIDTSTFWKKMTKENSTLRTTYINNQSKFMHKLRHVLLSKEIKQTDISIHGRYNRKLASEARSILYSQFDKKKVSNGIVYAIDNKNHLRNLYYLFKNENIGFFFQDNSWFLIKGYRNEMRKNDFEMLNNYSPLVLQSNEYHYFNFKNSNSLHGLGWTHSLDTQQKGIWSEGNVSSILFKLDENVKDEFNIEIKLNSILTNKNNPLIFEIFLNDISYKKIVLMDVKDLKNSSILLNLNKKSLKDKNIYLKFKIKNPITKLELLKSPDARRLGVLIESIKLNT